MNDCDKVQSRLADEGSAAVQRDTEMRHHVETCVNCARFVENLTRVEAALRQLPAIEPSNSLVDKTLEAVSQVADNAQGTDKPSSQRRRLASGLAASVVIAAIIGLAQTLPHSAYKTGFGFEFADSFSSSGVLHDQFPITSSLEAISQRTKNGVTGPVPSAAPPTTESSEIVGEKIEAFADTAREAQQLAPQRAQQNAAKPQRERRLSAESTQPELDEPPREADALLRSRSERIAQLQKQYRAPGRSQGKARQDMRLADGQREISASDLAPGTQSEAMDSLPRRAKQPDAAGAYVHPRDAPASVEGISAGTPAPDNKNENTPIGRLRGSQSGGGQHRADESQSRPAPQLDNDRSPAQATEDRVTGRRSGTDLNQARFDLTQFLDQYQSLDGLTFQDPTGYWANTYLPGDPNMRLLQARLGAWDRGALPRSIRLERGVRPNWQPFDAPENAALAVYLHSDKREIHGPTRLRLQVGIKGAQRRGGRRPAMNVGLVVDLRSAAADHTMGLRVRALITALEQARQPGDRFSLTVAGPSGGVLVPPEQFKHGPLQVTANRLFAKGTPTDGAAVGLMEAVSLAAQSVRDGDDPGAMLGSSVVLLAAASSITEDLTRLEQIAHKNAVNGVLLSVIRLGPATDQGDIDRLVAAGQGNRWILQTPAEAKALVARELHSASRAVARAVRLRIRLARGIKLINVLGSRRLEEPLAQRVREAELRLDQRLAQNLGIRADRGEDEEGIQIVIPSFSAGDAHVILLDVVAEGPGPIADVTARYKDVAFLRNGVAQARLTIRAGHEAPGPLERNVLKNLVAWELSRQTRRLSSYLARGQAQQAAKRVALLQALIRDLRSEVAGWSSDPDLAADETMLGEYLAALGSHAARDAVQRSYLADSLRYAAFRKLQPAAQ